jgi:hypothetical protein
MTVTGKPVLITCASCGQKYSVDIGGYHRCSDVVLSRNKELYDIKDFYRWRKYPEEKPEKDGIYFCFNKVDSYKYTERMRYENGKWLEEEYDDFQGSEQEPPTMWTNLPPLEDK